MSWAVRLGRGVLRCSAFVCSAPFRCLVGWERQNWQNTRGWRLVSSGGLRRGLRPGRLPELAGNLDRVDPSRLPPQQLVARAVELAVVQAAERNGEFVADLAPEGEPLGEAHVVRLGGLAPANEAGSGRDVLEVIFIAKAPGFPEGEDALVDAVRGAFLSLRAHCLVARFRRLRAGFSSAGGRRRQRLWFRRYFLKRRDSKCEGRLDEPGVARGQS